MAFQAASCPQCKGALQLPDDRDVVNCMYCGASIVVREAVRASGPAVDTILDLAQKAMDGQNAAEAFQLFSRALEQDPKNYVALMGKGEAAGWLSTISNMRFTEMATYFNEAIAQAPEELKPGLRKLACLHVKTVMTALWSSAGDHAVKYAALDDTWQEWVEKAYLFVAAGELAHTYDPADKVALQNIVTTCKNLLQGIAYETFRGNPSVRQLTPEQAQRFQASMDKAVWQLKKLDPAYEAPQVKKASGGCLLLFALLSASAALAASW
jgi:hypothetical protein